MTINEFADKYAKRLYEKNTEDYFNEVSSIIDNLESSGNPISLDLKIEIWKQIQKQIQELKKPGFKHLYEHENGSVLSLISLTLKTLEGERNKQYV